MLKKQRINKIEKWYDENALKTVKMTIFCSINLDDCWS